MDKRNYGLDIARIIAMCGIVILHIIGAGGLLEACENDEIKYWVTRWVQICAYTSVDLFAVLSGYLGIFKKKVRSYRAFELIIIVLSYCVICTILFLIFAPECFTGIKQLAISLCPPVIGRYWYITCYIPIALLQPYINKMILSMNEKQNKILCVLILILFSVIPSLTTRDFFKFSDGYSFVWLLCCYVLGAHIRRTEPFKEAKNLKTKCAIIFILSSLILVGGNIFIYIVIKRKMLYFVSYISPMTLLMSLCVFFLFKNVNITRPQKALLVLSGTAFEVYLIHCHAMVYDHLITNGFRKISEYPAFLIPFIIIGITILLYIILAFVGFVRMKLFELLHINKLTEKISLKYDKIFFSALE